MLHVLIVLLTSFSVFAQNLTIIVSKNVAILPAEPDENFSGNALIDLGPQRYALFAYPLTSIPSGCMTTNAMLYFPACTVASGFGASSIQFTMLVQSNPPWQANTVTYNTRPSTTGSIIGQIQVIANDNNPIPNPQPLDITQSVNNALKLDNTEIGFFATLSSSNVVHVPTSVAGTPSFIQLQYLCTTTASPTTSIGPTSTITLQPTSSLLPTTVTPITTHTPTPSQSDNITDLCTLNFNEVPQIPSTLTVFIIITLLRAFVIATCLVMFILCLINRKSNFILSRSFTPYCFLIWKILSTGVEESEAVPASWLNSSCFLTSLNTVSTPGDQFICYAELYALEPLFILNIVALLILFYQFFSKRMLMNLKANQTETLVWKARLLQFTSSKVFLALIMSSVLLLVFIVGLIQIGVNEGFCKPTDLLFYFETFISLIVGITIVIMSVIDFARACSCNESLFHQFKTKFFDDDPLLYRAEYYIMGFAILNYVIIRASFKSYAFISKENNNVTAFNVPLVMYILQVIFWEIPSLVALPGILLIGAARFSRIVQMSAQQNMYTPIEAFMGYNFESSEQTIHLLMGHPRTHDLLRDFACKELSLENILIYDDIKRYMIFEDMEQRKIHAKLIINMYLQQNSQYQVNLDKRRIEPVVRLYTAHEQDPVNNPLPQNMFEEILKSVVENLLDTYDRFFFYTPFQNYIKKANNVE
jgi:hypothetical protein